MPKDFFEDPVAVLRRHVFISPFYEDPVGKVAALIGIERVLFGSDWPHPEGLAQPLEFLQDIADLDPEQTRKVMSSNLQGLLEGRRD